MRKRNVHEGVDEGGTKRVRGQRSTLALLPAPTPVMWDVRRRERCTWVALREGEWSTNPECYAQLARVLAEVQCDSCCVTNDSRCNELWEAREDGMLLLSCNAETARYAATLPFFTRVRTLCVDEHVLQGSISMSLSACAMITDVCILCEPSEQCNNFERLTLMRTSEKRDFLRAWTLETATLLAALPVLRSLQLYSVWDPSVITTACASLLSLKCASCAMSRLEVFSCYNHFAFLGEDKVIVATALRNCHTLTRARAASRRACYGHWNWMAALGGVQHAVAPVCTNLEHTASRRYSREYAA